MLALTAERLRKRYGVTRALDNVSFSVETGESLAIVGSNGAGKSTLLSCIGGLLRPDAGMLRLFPSQNGRGRVAFAGHQSHMYGDLTISENLELVAAFRASSKDEREDILHALDVTAHRTRLIRECSPGMVRRAALARAFLQHPELLLLDEPTSGLDPDGRRRLFQLLARKIQSGLTVISVVHEADYLSQCATRVVELKGGRVAFDGPASEFSFERVTGAVSAEAVSL